MFWPALTFLGISFGLGENEVVWCQANTAWGQISRFHSPHGLSPSCKHKKGLGTKRYSFSPRFLPFLYSFPPCLNEEICQGLVSHLQAERVSLAQVGSCPSLPPAENTSLSGKSGRDICAHVPTHTCWPPCTQPGEGLMQELEGKG